MLTMRKIVVATLKEFGFSDIIEAEDGLTAWEVLTCSVIPVGLIISDWNMPNSTGLQFLNKVRESEKFQEVPFIMLTVEAELGQVTTAVNAGISNYIVKPFTAEVLKHKLQATYRKVFSAA